MIPCGPDSDSSNPRIHNGQKNLTMLAVLLVRANREPGTVDQAHRSQPVA
jgi:hypothetical protein